MAEIDEKLQEAIEAARAGDKDKAKDLLQDIVDTEPENAKAWLLMARVVDDDDERRICLANVLQIEPVNEQARKMLDKLEAKAEQTKGDEEVMPGITRKTMTKVLAGGAAFALVICGLSFFAATGVNSSRASGTASAARFLTQAAQTEIAFEVQETQAFNDTATFIAGATQTAFATITPTRSLPTLPPTFTPTPTEDSGAGVGPLPPPPPMLGKLVAWGGFDAVGTGFYELYLLNLQSGGVQNPIPVNNDTVRFPVIHPTSGQRLTYQRGASGGGWTLFAMNIDGAEPEELFLRWANSGLQFSNPEMPKYSGDGTQIVFVGTDFSTQTKQVYLLNLGTNEIKRLTNDGASYEYPAVSPDGTRVVAVRNQAGSDLVVIDTVTEGFPQVPITTDSDVNVESSPAFSADGTSIVYASAGQNSPNNRNIYLRFADGRGTPVAVSENEADEIYPVFSTNGQFIAFSSNRDGNYDIYVVQLSDGTVFQLTTENNDIFVGGWSQN